MSVTSFNQILPLLKEGLEVEVLYNAGGGEFVTIDTVEEKYLTGYVLTYTGPDPDGEDFEEIYTEFGLEEQFKDIIVEGN